MMSKMRRTTGLASTDPTTQQRLSHMQYASGKLGEIVRSASFLERQYGDDPEMPEHARELRKTAEDGMRALGIAMSAAARGPDLGHEFVVRAATRAIAKDLTDFSPTMGFSATLAEELDKREQYLATKVVTAGPAPQAATGESGGGPLLCHNCGGRGHFTPTCTSKGGGMYAAYLASQQQQGKPKRKADEPQPAVAAAPPATG